MLLVGCFYHEEVAEGCFYRRSMMGFRGAGVWLGARHHQQHRATLDAEGVGIVGE